MPKMKTNSAASKRAKITGTGKVKHVGSAMRHNLEHKSARKRREHPPTMCCAAPKQEASPASAEVSIGLYLK